MAQDPDRLLRALQFQLRELDPEEFRWPILARPTDLVTFGADAAPLGFPKDVSGARRLSDGSLVPYEDRAAIEAERRDPTVWVRDAVEAFLMQVQGSAQVEFPDGRRARLAYDGRNGLPYTSIGKILIEAGEYTPKATCRSQASRRGCAATAHADWT